MGENRFILNEWIKEINKYPRLKLKEAKELYVNNNIPINELILCTLYNVINFINKSGLIYLNSSLYDMNDIISTCNEIWIEKVNNGDLLKIDNFSGMFDSVFYTQLTERLGLSKIEIAEITRINSDLFISLFINYINLINNNINLTYNEFVNYLFNSELGKSILSRNYYYYYKDGKRVTNYDLYNINFIYELFNKIIDSFENIEDLINLSKTKIDKIKYILINNGLILLRKNLDLIITNNMEEEITNRLYNKETVKKILDSDRLTDREKYILRKRYGLEDGIMYSCKELAKELNVSFCRIEQIEAKAIRKCWSIHRLSRCC